MDVISDLPLLSVVIPCFNEEAVIPQTHACLRETLSGVSSFRLEFVYVDDGSGDGTPRILETLEAPTGGVLKVVRFARNFGHQAAITAGLKHATGDAVVLIDADLQDPPEVILDFFRLWKEGGYDVVYGVRSEREGESGFKRLTANLFYRFINRLSEVPIPLDTGDFRLMDRKVVEVLNAMPEHDRFIRGMVSWVGFRQCAHLYKRQARFAGESKYPLWKMVKFATDGIVSFSSEPLRLASKIGFMTIGLSFLGILYTLIVRLFTDEWVSGWAFIVVTILFFSGVQLFTLGILGEYVGRIYAEGKRRPLYVEAEVTEQRGQ